MSKETLYLKVAEDLQGNPGQLDAYNSKEHCVVLAGPGSGKTKTLTLKLAKLLSEDIEEPRGIACITYNNECAKELEQRLDALGIEPSNRVFIGTVHSFSLTQIVIPYAKTAKLGLPDNFKVATLQEQRGALERAFNKVIARQDDPHRFWRNAMDKYRRSILNRNSVQWRTQDPELANLVIAYENELRLQGLIDFDDMPLLALRALRENSWLQKAILAKYPVLIVDEYQDLGHALHEMVVKLCFGVGMRLFAVGDADQSIYGFTGAHPELLQQLAERVDVETVTLRFNYRCGSRIVLASEYALGEERGYQAPEDADEGTIYFHPSTYLQEQQADYIFSTILPKALERMPGISLGEIAILYPSAKVGDAISEAARKAGLAIIRTDGNSLYPRSSRLMRWLEDCALWCCNGWQSGSPRFSKLISEGNRIFLETLISDQQKLNFQRVLLKILWKRRNSTILLNQWLININNELLSELFLGSRSLEEERLTLKRLIERTSENGSSSEMTLGQFSGYGEGNDRINLSTLHSSKGREFALVILFGMDAGQIPWNNANERETRESRRLFYVGFTRAKTELHIMYTSNRPSRFVSEVQQRLEQA